MSDPVAVIDDELTAAAEELARRLRETNTRIVFAESCTGGLVAARLARIPGISDHLCGSAVAYRNATKAAWMDVPAVLLDDRPDLGAGRGLPTAGPVSAPVAQAMAAGVLARTPEADLAVAVTGHLGPDAPPDQDGLLIVAVARPLGRRSAGTEAIPPADPAAAPEVTVSAHRLTDDEPADVPPELRRLWRQLCAAVHVLNTAAAYCRLPTDAQ